MSLKERIESETAAALKARNQAAVSTLRMLRAAIKNAEIEKREPLDDAGVIEVIGREVKKLRDALESFVAGARQDLADKTGAEITALEAYLPARLSEEELREIIRTAIATTGAAAAQDPGSGPGVSFGKVMSVVSKETKGRADGSAVSALVKEMLGK